MSWITRLLGSFRKDRLEGQLDDELQFHIDARTQEFVASGMTPEEARYQAARLFGNRVLLKERTRDMDTVGWIENLRQDLRYGIRVLRKNPGFTTVAVLSLALGIGANTAIFSLIDAVMLKMLPVKNPEQLVFITWKGKEFPNVQSYTGDDFSSAPGHAYGSSISYPAFQQLRAQNQVLSDVFISADLYNANVNVNGYADIAGGRLVSGNYFSGLGIQAIRGRTFTAQDDTLTADPVVVISFRFWNRRFGADPSAVGRAVAVNGVPFTISGVTPREFLGLSPGDCPDIWIPVSMQPRVAPGWAPGAHLLQASDNWWVEPIGRLRPGITEQQARAALDVIFKQSITTGLSVLPRAEQMPGVVLSPASKGLNTLRSEYSQPLFILMSVVGLVLLIACANVANLLLARAAARRKETAVRLALGAGRWHLIRQSLTESVLLATFGGTLGLALAFRGGELLLALIPRGEMPLALDVRPDARILIFCAVISLVSGILVGLAPALRATRVDVSPVLKVASGSLRSGKGRSRLGLGKVLVASQVSMSLLLLIGAGLFVRSLQKLNSIEAGFNREHLLLFGIDGTLNGYKDTGLVSLYRQIQAQVAAIPGVRSVTLSRHRLIGDGASSTGITVPGSNKVVEVYVNFVGPKFLGTMGIPLLLGRDLTENDTETAPKVAVINETMARQFFLNQSLLGKKVGSSPEEVVGVARDAKFNDIRGEIPPTVYFPYPQHPNRVQQMNFEVRTAGNPTVILPSVRRAVAAVDRNLPLFGVKTQVQQIEGSLVQERLFVKLTSCFGLLALLLVSIGLYGVVSYAAVRRTGEIGIRIALGAQRSDVLWQVLRETMLLVAIGLSIGLPAALASTRLIRNQLFGLKPTDPFTISLATLVLVLVAVFAGYLPARRASRVDPMVALRYE